MDPALFDGYIFLRRQRLASSRHASEVADCIPPSSDIADRLSTLPENLRQLMALDAAETVSATLGNLESASDPGFLDMLTSVLTAFPAHFHLFAGSGDVKTIRAHLHAEGVLARVRFMGSMSESASVMALSDLYLAPFRRCRRGRRLSLKPWAQGSLLLFWERMTAICSAFRNSSPVMRSTTARLCNVW
jgi:hypothetical protein